MWTAVSSKSTRFPHILALEVQFGPGRAPNHQAVLEHAGWLYVTFNFWKVTFPGFGPRPLVLSGLTIRDSKLDRAPCEGMSFSSLAVVKRQSDFLSEFWKRGFPYWVSNPILQIFRGRLMGMERWHGRCRPPAHSHWLVCTIVPHLKERHKPHSLGLDWM